MRADEALAEIVRIVRGLDSEAQHELARVTVKAVREVMDELDAAAPRTEPLDIPMLGLLGLPIPLTPENTIAFLKHEEYDSIESSQDTGAIH